MEKVFLGTMQRISTATATATAAPMVGHKHREVKVNSQHTYLAGNEGDVAGTCCHGNLWFLWYGSNLFPTSFCFLCFVFWVRSWREHGHVLSGFLQSQAHLFSTVGWRAPHPFADWIAPLDFFFFLYHSEFNFWGPVHDLLTTDLVLVGPATRSAWRPILDGLTYSLDVDGPSRPSGLQKGSSWPCELELEEGVYRWADQYMGFVDQCLMEL